MDPVLQKLRLKEQTPILILNEPDGLEKITSGITAEVHGDIQGKYQFILAFARDLREMEGFAKSVVEAIGEDGYLWICYPKGTLKKYRSDINRIKLLAVFGPYDFEGVTQISIDDDWSALRVKPVDKIKTMKRKWAMSDKGKERIKDNAP